MDDREELIEPKSAKTPGLEHHNLNAIIWVEDPIDERDEFDTPIKPAKKGKKKK